MNKTEINEELKCLADELSSDENEATLAVVRRASDYIDATPVTFDKETIYVSLACYGCHKKSRCKKEWDSKDSFCVNRKEEAAFFAEHQIFDNLDDKGDRIDEN